MVLYKILSIINLIGCLIDIWVMIRLIYYWNTPKPFWATYYYFFLCTFLFAVGQVYTLQKGGTQWPVKLSITVYILIVFSFCKALEQFSTRKPRSPKITVTNEPLVK